MQWGSSVESMESYFPSVSRTGYRNKGASKNFRVLLGLKLGGPAGPQRSGPKELRVGLRLGRENSDIVVVLNFVYLLHTETRSSVPFVISFT